MELPKLELLRRPAVGCLGLVLCFVLLGGCTTPVAPVGSSVSTTSAPPAPGGPASPSVPAEYRATYATLSSNLADLEGQDTAGAVDPAVSPGGTVMAGALNLADGNRGTALLSPGTLSQIGQILDRFQQIGLKGVMLEIGYPMLLPGFPNSSAYLGFYERVANLVASHSMELSVECNPVFPNPQISSLHPDYSGLTVASYAAGQRQEAQTIVDDLHPKYLTILDEPSTFAHNLGLPIGTAASVVSLLDEELDGLQRDSTLIGAGIGTWEDPEIEQAIATRTAVDYLSVHLYPTGSEQIANLNEVTEIAARARKPLVMDETWLSKSDPSGSPGAGNAVVEQTVKNWSFWEPLDAEFMAAVTDYARSHGFSLVSPFSTDLFFGYVPWTSALATGPSDVVRNDSARIQLSNIEAGLIDPVGLAYQRAIG